MTRDYKCHGGYRNDNYFFFKISVHSLAAWGIIGIFVPLNTTLEGNVLVPVIAGSIVLAGLIMSSRLKLDAHTPREVTVGAMVGFGISFFGMLWLF
ncbi:MAG: phosphatase PAP2 family protein [Flammeovirgaceae bacterium]|nr:phosphatase PAP2 family protein [Flammeovirgaceae bacterium]